MTRAHETVSDSPKSKARKYTAESAADGVTRAIEMLEGRWKLVILLRLFGGRLRRFSELERAIPGISQKMLAQQLRQMERDGIVRRIVHAAVPPKVEYGLTEWGQSLCSSLHGLLKWLERRPTLPATESSDDHGGSA